MSDKWVLVPVEPTAEMLEPMAREDCKHDGFDPDEPMPPHGHYPRWYDRCGPFAEIYRAMLAARPAAPAQEDEVERVAKARADYWAQRMDDAAALVAALTAERDALRWALRNMRTAAICFEAVAPEDDAIQDIREELVEAFVQSSALAASPAAPAQDGFNAGIEAAAKLLDKAHDEWLGWADGAPPEGLEHYVTLAGYAEGYAASIRELKNPTGEILSGFECSQCRGIWRRGQPESHEDGCPLAIRALKREG